MSSAPKSHDFGYTAIEFAVANRTMPRRTPPLLSYLRLFRLPNVFTAVADVMINFLFVERL